MHVTVLANPLRVVNFIPTQTESMTEMTMPSHLYVSNFGDGTATGDLGKITVYPTNDNGNAAPTRNISGKQYRPF